MGRTAARISSVIALATLAQGARLGEQDMQPMDMAPDQAAVTDSTAKIEAAVDVAPAAQSQDSLAQKPKDEKKKKKKEKEDEEDEDSLAEKPKDEKKKKKKEEDDEEDSLAEKPKDEKKKKKKED